MSGLITIYFHASLASEAYKLSSGRSTFLADLANIPEKEFAGSLERFLELEKDPVAQHFLAILDHEVKVLQGNKAPDQALTAINQLDVKLKQRFNFSLFSMLGSLALSTDAARFTSTFQEAYKKFMWNVNHSFNKLAHEGLLAIASKTAAPVTSFVADIKADVKADVKACLDELVDKVALAAAAPSVSDTKADVHADVRACLDELVDKVQLATSVGTVVAGMAPSVLDPARVESSSAQVLRIMPSLEVTVADVKAVPTQLSATVDEEVPVAAREVHSLPSEPTSPPPPSFKVGARPRIF